MAQVEIERDIAALLESDEVGQLLLSVEPKGSPDIDGIGSQTAACIVEPRGSPDIAAVGDPAHFKKCCRVRGLCRRGARPQAVRQER